MITVAILINGNPLMARSATNTLEETPDGAHIYFCDDGTKIIHNREDGAVKLAIKILKTIKEIKPGDNSAEKGA